jgi:AcrR family transcriptional regulator
MGNAAGRHPVSAPTQPRRRYESPVRQQRAAETRQRILVSGSELLHGVPVWNWGALTVRAVAQRAGVNERTVYRHFANERALRDAVMGRMEEEAGVDLEGLELEDVADVTAHILEFVSSFPLAPRAPRDSTVAAANRRQREALLAAVSPSTREWSTVDRALAASMLDVLWGVVSYEKLVVDWELDPTDAIRGIAWVIRLVEDAIREGRGPDA